MTTIGIDIGTSSICAVKYNWDSHQVETLSVKNDTAMPGLRYEYLQNANLIRSRAQELLDALDYTKSDAVGISSQMHGIVYLDSAGSPVSPLITWQDQRGNEAYSGSSYASFLSSESGYFLATGFGAVTHFYNTVNQAIPTGAKTFCTIGDYLQLSLNREAVPLLHPSHAAALGFYDFSTGDFDHEAIRALGMDPSYFPAVLPDRKSQMPKGKRAFPSIGDHQASFLGSVRDLENTVLVNLGTGGQISFCTDAYIKTSVGDTRPLLDGKYLCSYSSLCGGRSYAVIHHFMKDVLAVSGFSLSDDELYEKLGRLASAYAETVSPLFVDTRFCGTRENIALRGSIAGISDVNLTAANLVLGTFQGAAEELYAAFRILSAESGITPSVLLGSGNGLIRNKAWVAVFERLFQKPMQLSTQKEAAAFGAAFAACYGKSDKTLEELLHQMQK